MIDSGNSLAITNDASGVINGEISSSANDAAITNSGEINGNISATTGYLSLMSLSQTQLPKKFRLKKSGSELLEISC